MKILVAYACRMPAARLIAERIAITLRRSAVEAHVTPIDQVHNIRAYDGVVVGSSMASGAWSKDARDFIDRNRDALGRVPIWLFSSGPPGAPESPPPGQLAEFQAAIKPVVHWLLAGPDLKFPLREADEAGRSREIHTTAVA